MSKIVETPSAILKQVAKPVNSFDKKLQSIIADMKQTLLDTKDPIGVGLAAPQVNLSLRIFQMRPDEQSEVRTFINPEIVSISDELNDDIKQSERLKKAKANGKIPPPKGKRLLEGCLSIPNIWGYVQRKKEVTILYQDEKGKKHEEKLSGFPAVIVQHEIDHLNGILFTHHVMEQDEVLYKSHKDENGEDVFEEVNLP